MRELGNVFKTCDLLPDKLCKCEQFHYCPLFTPPLLHPPLYPPLIPASYCYSFFNLLTSLFFLPLLFLSQCLARCLIRATGRSRLTDGWIAEAEAIRCWAEWKRTCPVHYKTPGRALFLTFSYTGQAYRELFFFFKPLLFQRGCDIWNSCSLFLVDRALFTFLKGAVCSENLDFFFMLFGAVVTTVCWRREIKMSPDVQKNRGFSLKKPFK